MSSQSMLRISAALMVCGLPLAWCAAQDEGPAPVRVIVRAESKSQDHAPLQASDLKLEFNGKKVDAITVQPLLRQGAKPVEVALLIDDGLRANFGTQLQEVEQFVDKIVSPQVSLGIGYMRNGRAEFPSGFSTEPEQEKKAIRLPISVAGIDGSPYFCLDDLMKHWPTNTGAARVVLMITSGIDRYNGSVSPLNQDSPYVTQATENAQRAGVPVYSIYYGRREVNSNLGSFSGQSYLSQVADGTGGESFNQGTINPVTLSPYFTQFSRALQESYLVGFQTGSRKLERFKVSTTASGVKVHAAQAVSAQGARS